MTEKEINLKSVIFLVIGILLLLSLVICIYIVNGERDLISVEAKVVDVKKDENGTGKNDITVSYDIDETSYNYNFYYKDNIELDDKITIYYHKNNINSVTTFKTTKFIFVCPIIGLILCILSLFELFRQNKNEEDLFQTAVIDISGTTQKLEIVTDDTMIKEYQELPEEQVEAEVKVIKKNNKNQDKEETKKPLNNNNEETKKEEIKEDWYVEVKEEQPLNDTSSKDIAEISKDKENLKNSNSDNKLESHVENNIIDINLAKDNQNSENNKDNITSNNTKIDNK